LGLNLNGFGEEWKKKEEGFVVMIVIGEFG
jgi:hypothetical protein